MSGYLTALIIMTVITAFFIFLFIVNLIFIYIFSVMLKKHEKALIILVVQRYEAIENLFKIYERNNISVKKDLLDLFNSIDKNNFELIDNEQSFQDRNKLAILKQELVGCVKRNESFQKNEEFQIAVKSIESLDSQFRNVVAAYNADVLGYNYWVRFKIFRYLYLYNRVELKDIIS